MTLDEMIQQCAVDIEEDLVKVDGQYTDDTARKIVAGINYAYRKIAREKHVLTNREAVVLGDDGSFSQTTLTLPVVQLFNVYDNEEPINWEQRNQTTVLCLGYGPGETLMAEYSYLPPALSLDQLDGSPLFPVARVDHMLLCYYADFYVLSLEPDNESNQKKATFLGLFNDGYESIRQDVSSLQTMRVER